jgi:hypothetical protein
LQRHAEELKQQFGLGAPLGGFGQRPSGSRSIGSMNAAFAFGSDSSSLRMGLTFGGILVF